MVYNQLPFKVMIPSGQSLVNSEPFSESRIPWNWGQKCIYLHEPFSTDSVLAGDLGSGADCQIKGSRTG